MAKKKEEINKIKCNACGNELGEKEFPESFSFKDKQTGRLTICKNCCSDLYDRLTVEYQDEIKALYRLCMMLDLYFSKDLAISLQSKSRNADRNLGFLYISKIGLVQYRKRTFKDSKDIINIYNNISDKEMQDMIFLNVENSKEEILQKSKEIITPEIIKRWGKDLELDDYIFLEDRYNTMLNAYDDKNPSSLWTYQEICYNYLLLRQERGNPVAQKNLNDVISKLQSDCKMKLSQIDAGEDESACFGKFVDKIENYEPCEKKLPFFEDIDGVKAYIKKWFCETFAKEWGIKEHKKDDISENDESNNIDDEDDDNE